MQPDREPVWQMLPLPEKGEGWTSEDCRQLDFRRVVDGGEQCFL